ncbi:MAG: formylglycine-generating enzyme family protein [Paludibacteraceae bacterium]|nr:formylglycine-generating enzyme family protein [Paludibacteraceae bacterium]
MALALSMASCGSSKKVAQSESGEMSTSTPSDVEKTVEKVDTVAENSSAPIEGKLSERTSFTVKDVVFSMVKVKGGSFVMGATPEQSGEATAEEKPAHKVSLPDYWIGETEVTQALWTAVMGSCPSQLQMKGDSLPVACVSWDACQQFIAKLNALTGKAFRLPTEAEWEFAARGGAESKDYKYSGGNTLDEVARCDVYASDLYYNVASYRPNELGIYDMSGNVAEWCEDWYGAYAEGEQSSPKGPKSGEVRVSRGGGGTLGAPFFRVSSRDGGAPGRWFYHVGLRLVASAD